MTAVGESRPGTGESGPEGLTGQGGGWQQFPDAVVTQDLAGTITNWNYGAEILYGYLAREMEGQPYVALIPEHARLVEDARSSRVAEGERIAVDRAIRLHRDGSLLEVSLLSSPVIELHGRVTGVVTRSRLRDQSAPGVPAEQPSNTAQIEPSEPADVGFIVLGLDDDGLTYVSPGFEQIFDYDDTTDRQDPSVMLRSIHPQDMKRFRTQYWEPTRKGLAAQSEFRIVRKDGEVRWVRATGAPVVDADGTASRVSSTVVDVTDLKLTEAALHVAHAAAEQANAAKNEFLSRMSHELRTPLNAVLGFAQLLELDILTSEQQDAVRHILHGGRHLLGLIDDVLDIAKIETDRMDLSLEIVLMSELLSETVDLMRPLARAAGVSLSYVPDEVLSQHVHGDNRRLRQVVLNLLSNAIKYNRPGGLVEVRCRVTDDSQMEIAVTDDGLGIRAVDLPRLFTPFDRLGAQTTGIEGTGVGLALSQRLMAKMGGSLRATSELGVGSTFTASIPLAAGTPELGRIPARGTVMDPRAKTDAVAVANKTLVYIEDNGSNIRLMERLVGRRSDWRMIVAGHAALGLELASTNSPDLILLDLHLPDMDGIEVLHLLRAGPRTSAVPVVVVSADANPHQITRLLAAGAHGYLTKPLAVADVLELLDSCAAGADPQAAFTPTRAGH